MVSRFNDPRHQSLAFQKKSPREESLAWLDRKFPTEQSVRDLFERLIWPDGAYCPHCGSCHVWRFKKTDRKSRPGLYECRDCNGQFTVTTRTPMHATKLPLRTWLRAMYFVLTSSKGVSSVVLGKQLGVTQKTAWKLSHSIRTLMERSVGMGERLSGFVEVDTTWLGGRPANRRKTKYDRHVYRPRGRGTDRPQIAIAVERDGRARAEPLIGHDKAAMQAFMERHIDLKATIMSDNDRSIAAAAVSFKDHQTVVHSDREYVRGKAHSNTTEGIAALLKRAQFGVYHQMSRTHLQRYVNEACFRFAQRIVTYEDRAGKKQKRTITFRPFMDQLSDLMMNAGGCRIRRTDNFGLEWIEP